MDLSNAENEDRVSNAENEDMEVNNEVESHGQTQNVTQRKPVRPRKRKAKCWEEFTLVGVDADGKKRARCHHCHTRLVVDKTHGTSHLNRHLASCPEKSQPTRPIYDHQTDRKMTSEIIIYHDLPFRYVEYEKVRARDKFLNPDCQHICRQTAALDVYKRYETEKAKLIEVLANHKGRVSFTADLWSARSTLMGYICLTAHYIDDSWLLNNKILAFCDFKPPHNGEEIAKKVYDCLKEWGLEKKVFTITLDNAKANDSMQMILKHRLQSTNGLLCDGKFLHVRCCAHVLNLIVKAGLEVANRLLENIRDSVKFVKASESRKDSFAACVESVGITSGAGLSFDVCTRWNSTYEMLARALKFRKAFGLLHLYERGYNSLPSEEDWDRGEKICDLLKPFNTITTYMSGVKYPTANVYFIQVWKIELLLKKYANCDDDDVRTMAQKMKKKFTKYWDEYSIILAVGAALDPRLKLDILKSAYDKIDPMTSEEKVGIIRQNLILLYDEYKAKSASSSKSPPTLTPHELLNESPLEDDCNDDLFELESSLRSSEKNSKTNLEIYLDVDPRLEMKTFTDMEVLNYWKENQHRYGALASMASDLLSIPITTVASESAFSVGGRVLNPYRNRLLPKNVQALICTRNWLRGFAEFEGDIGDIEDNFEAEDTTSASRVGDNS